MNMRFELRYLTGGDATFGPNFGGAAVYTNTRAGYSAACPNIGRLLSQLHFTTRGESQLMGAILDQHQSPDAAAGAWLAANAATVADWLDGVVTVDGRPARDAIAQGPAYAKPGVLFDDWSCRTRSRRSATPSYALRPATSQEHGTVARSTASRLVVRGSTTCG